MIVHFAGLCSWTCKFQDNLFCLQTTKAKAASVNNLQYLLTTSQLGLIMLHGVFFFSHSAELIFCRKLNLSKNLWTPLKFISFCKVKNFSVPLTVKFEDVHYIQFVSDKVYIAAALQNDQDSVYFILEYLEKTVSLLRDFLGVLTPVTIQENVGLVSEVLIESLNATCPKLIEPYKLKPFLCSVVPCQSKNSGKTEIMNFMPDNLFGTNARKKTLSSKAKEKPIITNQSQADMDEVFIDLIETLSVIIDATGLLLYYDVQGKLEVKSYLQNDASITLFFTQNTEGLSLSHILGNAIIHSNVSEDDSPNILKIRAIPGTTQALKYCLNDKSAPVALPFTLFCSIIPFPQDKMIAINLKLHCSLPTQHPAVNMSGCINLPADTFTASGSSTLANMSFEYDRTSNAIKFNTPLFPGDSHHSISAKVLLTAWRAAMAHELSTAVLKFEVPMWCHSNTTINNIKVTTANASQSSFSKQVKKYIRYLTHTFSYEFYLNENWFISDN